MQCGQCSGTWSRQGDQAPGSAIEAADRRSQLRCEVCGSQLVPRGTLVDRVTARLSRFARFGLTADASPLFELHRHQ